MARPLLGILSRCILSGPSKFTFDWLFITVIYLVYRYAFPSKPIDGIIDLTTEDQQFYFNSYSGELSLEFPKAERKCKGGILAYVKLYPIF